MTREERIINKIGDQYSVKLIEEDGPKSKILITHKECGCEKVRQYAAVIRYGYQCECLKKKEKMKEIQQKIDEYYGENRFILEDLGNIKNKESKVRVVKCNHLIEEVKISAFLKNKKTYGCPICDKSASNRYTDEDINQKLYDKFKNKIEYISGYDGAASNCLFRFKPCNHEHTMHIANLFNRKTYADLQCPTCNDKDRYRRKDIESVLLPIYKTGERLPNSSYYKVHCSICGSEQPNRRAGDSQSMSNRCNCERDIQKEIIDCVLDVLFKGKTDRKSNYVDIEKLIEIQTKRKINYKISKGLYKDLNDIYNKYISTLRDITTIKLPYDKIEIDLTNNETILIHSKKTNYFITKIVALNLNCFDVETVVYIEYKNTKTDYSTCFYTRKNKPITFVRTDENGVNKYSGLRYECNKIGNLAINIIQYLTNIYNIEKEVAPATGRTNNVNNYVPNEFGVTEYKTLVKDTKKKYATIKNNSTKKRKIMANFTVAGHYMHFQNGNKSFRDTYEKGEEYRHIRRIEKDYIIK